MRIQLYGTRGGVASPSSWERQTHEFGGNTTCIYVETDDGTKHIIDAGTGIVPLGRRLLNDGFASRGGGSEEGRANLYITHRHQDHIQGLPFFGPAYNPANKIAVYGQDKNALQAVKMGASVVMSAVDIKNLAAGIKPAKGGHTMQALSQQQTPELFPVGIDALKALQYNDFAPGVVYQNPGLIVEARPVPHPGGCVSYRFTEKKPDGSKTVFVFTGDYEPQLNDLEDLVEWFSGADLVLADSQYEPRGVTDTPNPFMVGFGHSDYQTNTGLASAARAKRLVLTHHEPKMDDDYHRSLEAKARDYAAKHASGLVVDLAREGKIYTI